MELQKLGTHGMTAMTDVKAWRYFWGSQFVSHTVELHAVLLMFGSGENFPCVAAEIGSPCYIEVAQRLSTVDLHGGNFDAMVDWLMSFALKVERRAVDLVTAVTHLLLCEPKPKVWRDT